MDQHAIQLNGISNENLDGVSRGLLDGSNEIQNMHHERSNTLKRRCLRSCRKMHHERTNNVNILIRYHCLYPKLTAIIFVTAITFFAAGFGVGYNVGKHVPRTNDQPNHQKAQNATIDNSPSYLQMKAYEEITTGNKYRLPENSPSIQCTRLLKIYREEKDCDDQTNDFKKHTDQNSMSYKCGIESYEFQDLLDRVRKKQSSIKCSKGGILKLGCCLLSYLGNLNNYCETGSDSYKCYKASVHTDKGISPLEPMCEKPFDVTMYCNCYQSTIPVCGHDSLPECEKLDGSKNNSFTKCHMTAVRKNTFTSNYCTCRKFEKDENVDSIQSCKDLYNVP